MLEKSGPGRAVQCDAIPGTRTRQHKVYDLPPEIQDAIISSTREILDVADRYLSAYFHLLCGSKAPPGTRGFNLPIEVMPTHDHRAVLRALRVFEKSKSPPTRHQLRQIAISNGYIGAEKILNEFNHDLIDVVDCLECCASGLHSYAGLLSKAHRRRLQVARLWRTLSDRCTDPFGEISTRGRHIAVRFLPGGRRAFRRRQK